MKLVFFEPFEKGKIRFLFFVVTRMMLNGSLLRVMLDQTVPMSMELPTKISANSRQRNTP